MNNAAASMEITSLDAVAIVAYFVVMAVLAYLTRRNRTFNEFALGKHSIPALMIFASLAATIVGPGFSVGFTAKGYVTGYLFYFLCLSYPFQTIVSGLLLAPRLTRLRDCATLGDVMNKSYGRFAQFLTGVISVGLLMGFTAIMGKIGGSMLQSITGWPLLACLVVVTGSTALLTFTGGLRATVATEAFQFSLFSIAVPIMLLLAIWQSPISLVEHSAKAWELTSAGFGSMSGLALFGVIISFLLGEVLLPPYANRALAAKSSEGSVSGFVMAGFYTIVWLGIVAVLGVIAHSFLPAGTSPDSVFIAMGKQLLPVGIYGVLLAAVIAIVMSSQESVLNSGAVAFVKDIVSVIRVPSEKTALLLGKISTLGIAAVAIYVAQFAPSIIDGLLILYSIWAPAILIPLIAALYGWRATSASGWLSMILGGGVSLAWQLLLKEPGGVPAILVGMVGSMGGFLAGRLIHTSDKAAASPENAS
jgi:SSS family solute:Na+ symporter